MKITVFCRHEYILYIRTSPSPSMRTPATLDGGLGYLLPIAEKTYRRLHMLQIKLVQGLPHTAGLNPKAFRLAYTSTEYCDH